MDEVGLPAGILLFLILGSIGVSALRGFSNPADRDFQTKIFLVAFALRFAASVVIYQFGLVEIIKDEDAGGWYVGQYWYQTWQEDGTSYFDLPSKFVEAYSVHHKGYYYLVAIFFYLTALPYRLSAAVLNCFIGAWTVVIGYRTARTLFSEPVAVHVGWWTCLYPSLIMWSAQTLKEPVVILLECLVIYGCASMRQRGKAIPSILLIASAIVLLIPFRFYAAYIASAAVILSFLFGSMSTTRDTSTKSLYFVLTSITFLVLAFFLLSREKETELMSGFDLAGLEKYRNNMAADTSMGSGSNVKIDSDLQSPGGFSASLLIGAAYLLFTPISVADV